MADILDTIFGLDILSLAFGFLIGLAPTIGFLIVRGALFEYQEWRKRKQKTKEWFNKVERTANGIKRAWHYGALRPEEKDKKRTAEEMDKYTDLLKEHRTHQNATDKMVEKMNEIIEFWDRSRSLVLMNNRSPMYLDRGERISDDAEELKEILDWERKGRVRKFISSLPKRGRSAIKRIRKRWYQRQEKPLPFEIYQEIRPYLSDTQIAEFTDGDYFLCIEQQDSTEVVFYEEIDEDGETDHKYNVFKVGADGDGGFVVVDKLQGKSVSDKLLYKRLREAESVKTISYDEIVPDGQTLDEFEHSDSN